MLLNLPHDIRAEVIDNYLAGFKNEYIFSGSHKRNAYRDILSISGDDDGYRLELSRQGLYDVLPEALFHPVDRFDSLPANEYKERFAEEVEQQRKEEASARKFFSLHDELIFGVNAEIARITQEYFGGNRVLVSLICDSLPGRYRTNRFVSSMLEFIPRCREIRGNIGLLTFILRKLMSEEGLRLAGSERHISFEDEDPRYCCDVDGKEGEAESSRLYLGNQYVEGIILYEIGYWNEEYCDEKFLSLVEEIKVFEEFINDYFMGLETILHFNLSTDAPPVRLSDELCHNYLNYNTNI